MALYYSYIRFKFARLLYYIIPIYIDRSRSKYDELVRSCGYAIKTKPKLYVNLKHFLTQCNNSFKWILTLFGGPISNHQITDV